VKVNVIKLCFIFVKMLPRRVSTCSRLL